MVNFKLFYARTLYLSKEGIYYGRTLILWKNIQEIKLKQSQGNFVIIKFIEESNKRRVDGLLPIFDKRKAERKLLHALNKEKISILICPKIFSTSNSESMTSSSTEGH